MKKADEFGKGLWVRQQMFYAAISLSFYNRDPKGLDTTALVKQLQEKYTPFKYAPGHVLPPVLRPPGWVLGRLLHLHVVAGDREGPLHALPGRGADEPRARACATATRVLEPGGAKDAALLVKDFLGRDYGFEAYEHWLNGT